MILIFRVFEILMPLFFIAIMSAMDSVFDWIITLAALLIWEVFSSAVVFAKLTDDGLAYLRWRKWRELGWSEIAYGGAGPVGFISIKRRGPIWRRYLILKAPNLSTELIESSSQAKRFLEAIQPPSGRTN